MSSASGGISQQVWQDSLDPKLTQRLMRPLNQPGVIGTQLAESILLRLQGMTNHLPVAQQLLQRLHWTKQQSPEPLPIVHAQPLSGESNGTSIVTTPSPPPAQKTQPSIGQGKAEVATTAKTTPNSPLSGVVQPSPASPKTVVSAKRIDSPKLPPGADTPGIGTPGMIQKAPVQQRPIVPAKGIDSPKLSPGADTPGMIQKAPVQQRPVVSAKGIDSPKLSPGADTPGMIQKAPVQQRPVVLAKGIDSPKLSPGADTPGMIQKAPVQQRPVVSAKGIDSPKLTPGADTPKMIQKASVQQRPVAIAKSTEKPLILQRAVKRPVVRQISRTTPGQSPPTLVFPLSPSLTTAPNISRIQSDPRQNGTGVIQRMPSGGARTFVSKYSQSASVIQRSPDNGTGNTSDSSGGGEIDVEDLADKVQRKLLKRMAIESERRGLKRWT